MPTIPQSFRLPVLAMSLLPWWGGCATDGGTALIPAAEMRVNEFGRIANTGLAASELVVACNEMLRGFGEVPEIALSRGRVRIVVEPVVNDSRLALAETIFNEAVLGQIALRTPRQWQFLPGGDQATAAADFFLANRLQRVRPVAPVDHEILLYTHQLIDARSSEIVWVGSAELKYYPLTPAPAPKS